MGYVTGEVSAADVAAIGGMLAAAARSLGSDDPRTEQQRRADVFADLLLGRLRLVDPDEADSDNALEEQADDADSVQSEWLEVRTSTQRRVSSSVLVCSASPPTGNPSANRSDRLWIWRQG